MPTVRLIPLFLACFAAIGYEIALTRFFAVSSWSEYGYWIISIAMVGLAASGTVAALAARPLVSLARPILILLPVLMVVAATVGWHWTTLVPFNPLELQKVFLPCEALTTRRSSSGRLPDAYRRRPRSASAGRHATDHHLTEGLANVGRKWPSSIAQCRQ